MEHKPSLYMALSLSLMFLDAQATGNANYFWGKGFLPLPTSSLSCFISIHFLLHLAQPSVFLETPALCRSECGRYMARSIWELVSTAASLTQSLRCYPNQLTENSQMLEMHLLTHTCSHGYDMCFDLLSLSPQTPSPVRTLSHVYTESDSSPFLTSVGVVAAADFCFIRNIPLAKTFSQSV